MSYRKLWLTLSVAISSIEKGMWFARSAEFMQTPAMQTLRWLRAIGDTMFAIGALALAYFIFSTLRGEKEIVDNRNPVLTGFPEPQID